MTAAVIEPGRRVTSAPVPTDDTRRFRPDIAGLRAVAVLLVVLYHAGVPGLTGGYVGVDVFFVISGFLITGHILREIDQNGRLALGAFYARRIRRLLPAAALVTVVTLVVARLWGPALQIRSTAWDALWTAGYAVNVHLANEGVDYQQATSLPSPLQHFWSLAVEEQFYLVWPLLVLLTVFLSRRVGRFALAVVVATAVLGSLVLSESLTHSSAPLAYFSAVARAWEFGIGAMVALAITRLAVLPGPVRATLAWAGLVLIVGSAFRYDDSTAFPGLAALAPVLGAAFVIAGGCGTGTTYGAGRVLDPRPMQWIGRFSYGWYLWHWPVLLLAPAILGQSFSWIRNVELSLLALWFAALTYVIVERPAMRARLDTGVWLRRGAALTAATALAAVAALTTAPAVAGDGAFAEPVDLSARSNASLSSALVTASENAAVPGNLSPALLDAPDDVPATESGCHLAFLDVEQGPCVYGDPQGTRTVVLFGDSHAQQWHGALDAAAAAKHWKLVSWTKAACPVADVTIVNPVLKREYTECTTWRENTVARINALHADVVIVSQSDSVPGRTVSTAEWAETTLAGVEALRQPGTSVEFLADTPYPGSDIPACVAENLADVRACQVTRADAYHASPFYTDRHEQVSASLEAAGVAVTDPTPWLCSPSACPVVVGNELVYRDDSHLSNTFSTRLAPMLDPLLAGASATRQENAG